MSGADHDPFESADGDAGVRPCAYQGCREAGEYRAPVSRRKSDGHYWFCLEHVRRYNGSWNYYAGMNEGEIEAHRRKDVTWRRPTWPLTSGKASARVFAEWRDGGLGLFVGATDRLDREAMRPRPSTPGERQALAVLDLDSSVAPAAIKVRYKELVKKYHPDANGGDRQAEERLKSINAAYAHLAACGYF